MCFDLDLTLTELVPGVVKVVVYGSILNNDGMGYSLDSCLSNFKSELPKLDFSHR